MKTVWARAVAAGVMLLLVACAPAATPAGVSQGPDPVKPNDVQVTPYPTPSGTFQLPAEEPLPNDGILRDYRGRGYIWIKGQFIKLPDGVKLTQVAPMRGGDACQGWKYCPQEIWTLYKGSGSFQFSPTDGIVINDYTDAHDPTAFAFLSTYVTAPGDLLDDWPPEWRRFRVDPPPGPRLRPTALPTPDPRVTFNEADVREMMINGSRMALPPGVAYRGVAINECRPGTRCVYLTVALQKGNGNYPFIV